MAAVLLSNPGLPLAVLGNPYRGKKRRGNPPYATSAYTAGGSFVGTTIVAKSRAALRKKLAARGLEVSSITLVKTKRRSNRRARKTTMSKKKTAARRRRSARSRIKSLKISRARAVGHIHTRKVRGRKYTVKVIGVRRGRGKKRKSLAVKWSGKKGSRIYTALSYGSRAKKGTHVFGFTNPKRRSKRRTSHKRTRRNPGIAADYVGGLTSAPNKIMSIFKGPGAVKNAAFLAGGTVGTFLIGGIISAKLLKPALEKFAPSFAAQVADPTSIQARIVGGALPYTAAFAITKLLGNKLSADMKTALMLGGAVASIVELIRPGMVGDALKKVGLGELPYAGPALAGLGALNGPVCGLGYMDTLAGYVEAPSYSGTNGYVEAPSYAGTAGYVEAPSYAGSAGMGQEVLAGTFLDDAVDNSLNNNWLTN